MIRSAAFWASLVALTVMVSGCARESSSIITLDDVTSERFAAVEAEERARFDDFLAESRDHLVEFGIPVPQFGGLVALEEIDSLVAQCIVELNPRLNVARSDSGFTVTYFGTVGDTYERIGWTIASCNAQYGVADLHAPSTVGWVEAAWRFQDATQRVMPCLRGIGIAVPTPPSAEEFTHTLGTAREFTPFSLAAADPVTLARAVALCPPSAAVLEAHVDAVTVDTPAAGVVP